MTSIVIPVGPYKSNKKWLRECIQSIDEQTVQPEEIILVDDGAGLVDLDWLGLGKPEYPRMKMLCEYLSRTIEDNTVEGGEYTQDILYCRLPWHTGISHAFNYGIAVAHTELVMMLGSDDTLEPTCLEKVEAAWEATNHTDGYYSVPIRYMDTDEVQTAPCNAAAITRGFFKRVGGFPIETAIGMGDNILLSICLAHNLPVYWVGHLTNQELVPLYSYRRHSDIHTFKLGKYFNVIEPLRDTLTRDWNEDEIKEWADKYEI